MISALIIEDYPVVSYGLKQMLREEFRGIIVGEATNAERAHVELAKRRWDMVIVDIDVPPGFRFLQEIVTKYRKSHVLALSTRHELRHAENAFHTGAIGYIPTKASRSDLIKAFRTVLAGEKYTYPFLVNPFQGRAPHEALSAREEAVMRAVASGKSGNVIAADLNLSAKTVSTYKRRVLNKLQVGSTADLVRYLIEHEL